jgi:hypothetical protein
VAGASFTSIGEVVSIGSLCVKQRDVEHLYEIHLFFGLASMKQFYLEVFLTVSQYGIVEVQIFVRREAMVIPSPH